MFIFFCSFRTLASEFKVYGKIAKELQFAKQEDKFNYKSHSGVIDLENHETRLGAKGSRELESFNLKYNLELGINSSRPDSATTTYKDTSGRVRIRLAYMKFLTQFGNFTFGQDWTPTALLQVKKFDPLASTGAGLHSLAHDYYIETPINIGRLGSEYRGRKDGWSYETPTWAGFKFTIWNDQNDDSDLNPATAVGTEYWEYLLSYEKRWNDLNMNFYLTHRAWDIATKEDERYNLFGWNFEMNQFGFSGSVSQSKEVTKATNKESSKDYLEIGISYKPFDKGTIAVTYGARENNDGVNANDSDIHNFSQVALGYIHQYNEYLRFHAVVFQFKYEEKDASLTANDNTALFTNLGAMVIF